MEQAKYDMLQAQRNARSAHEKKFDDYVWACREAELYFGRCDVDEIHILITPDRCRVSIIDGAGDEVILNP